MCMIPGFLSDLRMMFNLKDFNVLLIFTVSLWQTDCCYLLDNISIFHFLEASLPSCIPFSVKMALCWQAAAGTEFKHTCTNTHTHTHPQCLDAAQSLNAVFFSDSTHSDSHCESVCVYVCSAGLGCCPPHCHQLSSYQLNCWMALYPFTLLPLLKKWVKRWVPQPAAFTCGVNLPEVAARVPCCGGLLWTLNSEIWPSIQVGPSPNYSQFNQVS